jgi:hypothetical protein
MNKMSALRLIGAATALAVSAAQAETVKSFSGHGSTVVLQFKEVPKDDGSKQVSFQANAVLWIDKGDFSPGNFYGKCDGTGFVDKSGTYSGKLKCTHFVNEKNNDTYTLISDDDSDKGWTFTVTGGTGAFAGAKGGGSVTNRWGNESGDFFAITYDTKLIVP